MFLNRLSWKQYTQKVFRLQQPMLVVRGDRIGWSALLTDAACDWIPTVHIPSARSPAILAVASQRTQTCYPTRDIAHRRPLWQRPAGNQEM